MLTDKCKTDFENWFDKEYSSSPLWDMWKYNYIPLSMQYGVYVDYFDSVGICIHSFDDCFDIYKGEENKVFESNWFISRQEAREEAILKANEIYNKE